MNSAYVEISYCEKGFVAFLIHMHFIFRNLRNDLAKPSSERNETVPNCIRFPNTGNVCMWNIGLLISFPVFIDRLDSEHEG